MKSPETSAMPVAQTSSLLYRGFPIRRRREVRTACRLEVGDTAGWKPALPRRQMRFWRFVSGILKCGAKQPCFMAGLFQIVFDFSLFRPATTATTIQSATKPARPTSRRIPHPVVLLFVAVR